MINVSENILDSAWLKIVQPSAQNIETAQEIFCVKSILSSCLLPPYRNHVKYVDVEDDFR